MDSLTAKLSFLLLLLHYTYLLFDFLGAPFCNLLLFLLFFFSGVSFFSREDMSVDEVGRLLPLFGQLRVFGILGFRVA